MVVHELQVGTVIQCPTCHHALSIPFPPIPQPVQQTNDLPPAELLERNSDSSDTSSNRIVFVSWVVAWVIVTILGIFLFFWVFSGKDMTRGWSPFMIGPLISAGLIGLVAATHYSITPCPGCHRRYVSASWKNSRKDGDADRRFKHNTNSCNGCGYVYVEY